jgi:hypothetical protein
VTLDPTIFHLLARADLLVDLSELHPQRIPISLVLRGELLQCRLSVLAVFTIKSVELGEEFLRLLAKTRELGNELSVGLSYQFELDVDGKVLCCFSDRLEGLGNLAV